MAKGSLNAAGKRLQRGAQQPVTMVTPCNQQTQALAVLPPLGIHEMVGLETPSPQTVFQQHSNRGELGSQNYCDLIIKTRVMTAGHPAAWLSSKVH